MSASGIGTAAQIIVQSGSSIQAAVNSSVSGDIIVVKPGTYIENVTITKDKENLTIRSESGNPDNTIIKARSSHADVFLLKANNTKINGFSISGSTASGYAGIHLYYSDNCIIENNKLSNNACGIYLWFANRNNILKNTATNNGDYGGILLQASTFNTVSGNNVFNNKRGIFVGTSSDNTLSSNTVQHSSGDWGVFVCGRSPRSLIYNNYFNETNISIRKTLSGDVDTLNVAKTAGPNIVGGPYIGGNYWGKPDGTGFSQTAVDKNGDGFSDSAYINVSGSPYSDYLPLVTPGSAPILPVANFNSNVTSGSTPLTVLFTSTSTNAANVSWNFGDGTAAVKDSPVSHTFTNTGTSAQTFTVTLTATNPNGTSTKTGTVTVNPAAGVKPVASFTVSPTSGGTTVTTYTFNDTSSNSPTTWTWNFGDGTTGSGSKVTHKFTKAGKLTVTLTASNSAGSSTASKTVSVAAVKPVASFTYSPTTVKKGATITFTSTSTNYPTSLKWTFADNGATSTVTKSTHVFGRTGSFRVTLVASNSAGSSTVYKTITVS